MTPVATTFFFYFLAAAAVLSAILVITRRNPVHSALSLIITLLSLAGLYLMLYAPFVAGVQIILYAGGIMVLFLFVIMLLNLKRDPIRERGKLARRTFGGALVLVLLAEISVLLHETFFAGSGAASPAFVGINNGSPVDSVAVGNTVNIGRQLFTTYLLPFEIASVLLLVAIVGAVILAKRKLVS